jgi:transmembrane sensor
MSELERAAADWIARRNAGGLSPQEQAELEAWLAANSRHAGAFAGMESLWQALNEPRRLGCSEDFWVQIEAPAKPRVKRRTPVTIAAVAFAAAAVFVVAFVSRDAARVDPLKEPSVVVRPDRQILPDGSAVEFNSGAEIELAFTQEKRVVRLVKGEALFVVATDPLRPFVVAAGHVEVRAIGTAFAVRFEPRQVDVVVTEGRVTVERVAGAASRSSAVPEGTEPVYLAAGRRAVVQPLPVASITIQPISPTEIKEALAWRARRIEFTDTPLPVALRLFNRQNRVQFSLGDSSLNARAVTGIFWSDDPDTLARLLVKGLSLSADRKGEEIILYDNEQRR